MRQCNRVPSERFSALWSLQKMRVFKKKHFAAIPALQALVTPPFAAPTSINVFLTYLMPSQFLQQHVSVATKRNIVACLMHSVMLFIILQRIFWLSVSRLACLSSIFYPCNVTDVDSETSCSLEWSLGVRMASILFIYSVSIVCTVRRVSSRRLSR